MSTTLVNVSTRPVELHLPGGVTVLQPAERVDCDDASAGQVAALVRRGVLSALPAVSAPPASTSPSEDEEEHPKPQRTRRGKTQSS